MLCHYIDKRRDKSEKQIDSIIIPTATEMATAGTKVLIIWIISICACGVVAGRLLPWRHLHGTREKLSKPQPALKSAENGLDILKTINKAGKTLGKAKIREMLEEYNVLSENSAHLRPKRSADIASDDERKVNRELKKGSDESEADRPRRGLLGRPLSPQRHGQVDRIETSIVDGVVSRPNRWEWSVAIYSVEDPYMGFVCGGTIIDLRWVLTAAHCVFSARGALVAHIGAWNLTANDSKDSVPVEQIIVHPNYILTEDSPYDIALLKLVRNANVTDNPDNILTLPRQLFNLFELNPFCYIIGWGVTDPAIDVLSNVLSERLVNVISSVECQTRWDVGFVPVDIANTNICIDEGINGDVSACLGDSGSPVQCFDTRDLVWRLAGISSWGSSACSTFPSVYVKVQSYLDWIAGVMTPV